MRQNNDNKIFIIFIIFILFVRVSKICWLIINSILYVAIPYLEMSSLWNINK